MTVSEILTWYSRSQVCDALVEQLVASGCKEIEIVPLHGNSSALSAVLKTEIISDTFIKDGLGSMVAIEDFSPGQVTSETKCRPILLISVPLFDGGPLLPKINYLDKDWNWAELMINIIKTFGASIEKSMDDTMIPEEYLIDALKNNMGIVEINDCRIVILELVRCGILVEDLTNDGIYRFSFQSKYHCLNSGRQVVGDEWACVPRVGLKVLTSQLVSYVNRIKVINSREYLELLDYMNLFKLIDWDGNSSEMKTLIDLHYAMSSIIALYDRSSLNRDQLNEFFIEFRNTNVFLKNIQNLIAQEENLVKRISYQILCELKWNITGNSEMDEKIVRMARKYFCRDTEVFRILDEDNLYVPCVMKPVINHPTFMDAIGKDVLNRKIIFYDLVLSPY